MRAARTFTLSMEAIQLLDQLAKVVSDGNRSATIEALIRSASIETGITEIQHIGIPIMGWSDDEGNPRCHPNHARGVCPACYPEGVVSTRLAGSDFVLKHPHGWTEFDDRGRPQKRGGD